MTTPTATPTNPKEWEEYVNTVLETPEKAGEEINSGRFAEAVKAYGQAYAQSQNKVMADLKAQMEQTVTASVMDLLKRNGAKPDGARLDLRTAAEKVITDEDAPGNLMNEIWSGPRAGATMLLDILAGGKRSAEARKRMDRYDEIKNAYSGIVPGDGGYLVPEEVRTDILTRALEASVVRPQATVVPLASGKMSWPVNDMTTEVGSVYGGIAFAWLDEGETFPESSAAFAAIRLLAHKLGGLASIPNDVMRRTAALDTWVRTVMPGGLAHFEDLAFMKADGAGKPLGGLHANNPALIVANAESGQTSGITWVNVLSMFSRLLPESYATAEWDITPDAIPEIFTMALPVGTGGSAVMFGEGGGPNRLATTMLGIPIRWTRKAPAVLNTQGDISLADWTKYVIGDNTTLQFDTSEHSSFRSDKTDFRILEEVDGQPGMLSALTPENNGPTLSAFVQLATRS